MNHTLKHKAQLLLAAALLALPILARGNVSVSLELWHGYSFYYHYFNLSPWPTNAYHRIESADGTLWQNYGTNSESASSLTNNLGVLVDRLTNGVWKLYLNRGTPSETTNYFTVSISGVTSNLLGDVTVLYPPDGSSGIPPLPTFYWTGPSNFPDLSLSLYENNGSYSDSASLSGAETNWTPGAAMPPGATMSFFVQYGSNNFGGISLSTPTNSAGTPLAGWSSQGNLRSYRFSSFRIQSGGIAPSGLYGHYTFDNESFLEQDSSGGGNHAVGTFWTGGGTQPPQSFPGGISGKSLEFDGFNVMYWDTNLVGVLGGSYTVSLWIRTSQSYGLDTDDARNGATILAANGGWQYPVPMALTGSKLAFHTADPDDTLHSNSSINSNTFTHLVVTRDAGTGVKRVYVNGVLETTSLGGITPAIDASEVYLGYSYASSQGIIGQVDDLQIYAVPLTSSQVGYLYANPGMTAPAGSGPVGHTLLTHYEFENSGFLGQDSSPNGWHILSGSSWGSPAHTYSADAAAGSIAIEFYGNSAIDLPTNVFPALNDSFSLSAWVKTSQIDGADTDQGYEGVGIVWGSLPGPGDGLIPLSLTGTKAAFFTGSSGGTEETLHSTNDLSTGSYVHVVVTRDSFTGLKRIFLNGILSASATGLTETLDGAATIGDLRLGGFVFSAFQGLVDDLQIYSGVLSDAEVSYLYNNPGATVPNTTGNPLGEAVEAPGLAWTTGGDTAWFAQTNFTSDGVDAAQSGLIGDGQESWIETTVEGPGYIRFQWGVDSDAFSNDRVEFSIDGFVETGISGLGNYWNYEERYVGSGSHVLRWSYAKDGADSDGEDAGWLDEVEFVPEIEVQLFLSVERSVYVSNPATYLLFPSLSYVAPSPITTHEVESPNAFFTSVNDPVNGSSSSSYNLASLQEVIDECQAGDWRLFINRGDVSERLYTFTVTITGLDTNDLPPVTILSPTNGATGLATNHTFVWAGPTNYSDLYLYAYPSQGGGVSGGYTNLPPSTTSSKAPNPLQLGSNLVSVSYSTQNITGITLSNPEDASLSPLSSWNYATSLRSSAVSAFVVANGAPATPVIILNPQRSGTNFIFSMQSQAGMAHVVQCRTNLTTAPWVDLTNFMGDGNLKLLQLPMSTNAESYYRVGTQ